MHEVRKVNGRLVIVRDGVVVYHMPWWVRVARREDLRWLAERLDRAGGDDIASVVEFEARYSTVGKRQM